MKQEGRSPGCLWERLLCSSKETPERNSWTHMGWSELYRSFCDLRGTTQGHGVYAEGVRCEDGRNLGPWRRCWVSELIDSGATISHYSVKYHIWSILRCTLGPILTFLRLLHILQSIAFSSAFSQTTVVLSYPSRAGAHFGDFLGVLTGHWQPYEVVVREPHGASLSPTWYLATFIGYLTRSSASNKYFQNGRQWLRRSPRGWQ